MRRCENCDGPVTKGFTHQRYSSDSYTCKKVNWKKRALAAEKALAALGHIESCANHRKPRRRYYVTRCPKCGKIIEKDFSREKMR